MLLKNIAEERIDGCMTRKAFLHGRDPKPPVETTLPGQSPLWFTSPFTAAFKDHVKKAKEQLLMESSSTSRWRNWGQRDEKMWPRSPGGWVTLPRTPQIPESADNDPPRSAAAMTSSPRSQGESVLDESHFSQTHTIPFPQASACSSSIRRATTLR